MTAIELAVIGSMLSDETRQQALFSAPEGLFLSDEGKALFGGIQSLYGQGFPIEPDALCLHLQVEDGVEADVARGWVEEAVAKRASKDSLPFLIHSLSQSRVKSMVKALSEELAHKSDKARVGDVLARISEFQRELALLDSQRAETYDKAMMELADQQRVRFYVPGMGPLDKVVQFDEGAVCYVGGKSGGGKTAWVLNVALNIARAGHRVGIIEVEMRRKPLASRLGGILASLDTRRIMKGEMEQVEREHLRHVTEQSSSILSRVRGIEPSVFHADMLRPTMERWRGEWGCEVVIVDYLQNLSTKYHGDDYKHVTYCSRALTSATKETGMATIAVSQARRTQKQASGEAQELGQSDFKGSGQVEHDADTMLAFNLATDRNYQRGDRVMPIYCDTVKNRNGFTSSDLLLFDLPTQTFTHSGEFRSVRTQEKEKSSQFPL